MTLLQYDCLTFKHESPTISQSAPTSNHQQPPATTGHLTTACRLSYPGWRLAWGLSGWPGGAADRQTDTQTDKQTDRRKSRRNFA